MKLVIVTWQAGGGAQMALGLGRVTVTACAFGRAVDALERDRRRTLTSAVVPV